MLNEKLNLYNPEWLELVFTNRNKSYGAYQLRKDHGTTIAKAMAIAFSTIIVASAGYTYARSKYVEPVTKTFEYTIPDIPVPPKDKDKIIEQPKAAPAAPVKQLPAAPSVKFPPMKVVATEPELDPPKVSDFEGKQVAAVTSEGKGGQEQMVDAGLVETAGTGTEPAVDVNKEYIAVELMPEPDGGAAGWSKFLNKNLRYPYQAQEEGKSGRVFVSFVVERDGHLTDITVTGKAGYGMDEEAVRVLKLAKNWRPGKQNGNTVRVRYSIPINFVLTE